MLQILAPIIALVIVFAICAFFWALFRAFEQDVQKSQKNNEKVLAAKIAKAKWVANRAAQKRSKDEAEWACFQRA